MTLALPAPATAEMIPLDDVRAAVLTALPSGRALLIRPVAPADAGALQAYFRALTPRSRYDRLAGAGSELPAGELARTLAQGEGGRFALLVETVVDGRRSLIAEARTHLDAGQRSFEIALSVHDAWQRQGVGSALLAELEQRALTDDADLVVAEVLRTNDRSQGFLRRHGFHAEGIPGDWRSLRFAKALATADGRTEIVADRHAPRPGA